MWHFPDEQAHFSQVQNYAEQGLNFNGASSDEIAVSERFLGVYRDKNGNNKFTFHPEYNIVYSDTKTGLFEQKIIDFPQSFRTSNDYGLNETTSYPPLYYFLASLIYKIFQHGNLIQRVFVVRFFSVMLFMLNIWVVSKVAKLIINFINTKSKNYILLSDMFVYIFIILVGFHPMFSFMGASINSDVLFNLLFSILIYGSLLIVTNKSLPKNKFLLNNLDRFLKEFQFKNSFKNDLLKLTYDSVSIGWVIVFLSLFLGLMTKQQMVVGFAIIPILIWASREKIMYIYKKNILFSYLAYILIVFSIVLTLNLGNVDTIWKFWGQNLFTYKISLWEHLKFSFIQTYKQTLPWYWGVFRWLSLTLPHWVNRIQMFILLVSGIGLVLLMCSLIIKILDKFNILNNKLNQLTKSSSIIILFFFYISILYYFSLIIWDWGFRMSKNFSFGIQGRYFFPVIIAQMGLIIFTLNYIAKLANKYVINFRKVDLEIELEQILFMLLSVWWIVLHTIALWTVASSYYDMSSVHAFIIQISQYKPSIFKGGWWYLWLISYVLFVFILIYQMISIVKYKYKLKNKN